MNEEEKQFLFSVAYCCWISVLVICCCFVQWVHLGYRWPRIFATTAVLVACEIARRWIIKRKKK